MNERSKLHAIEYRRLIASVAAHLSAEEVERIAFIRLSGVDNSPCITGEKTSALQTLAALERQGEFSLQNIDGLLGIVKDVNRHDLIELIENYKKARALARKPGKSKTHRPLRKHSNPSEGRRQLEETHEMMVTSFTFLEQQMSLIPRLLEGEGDIQDEGTVILHSLKHAAEELAGKLGQAHEYFLQHSRSRASSGSESPRGSFEDTTSEDKRMNPDHLTQDDKDGQYSQQHSKVLKQLLVRPPITSEVAGVKDEEQDFTGDSGFSASSRYYDDHDAYCVVDLWRRPPATRTPAVSDPKHVYMSVMKSSMNTDSTYAACTVQTDSRR